MSLWKLLSQRNRGISLEGYWRFLTHKPYKFWGIYIITKLNMEINLSQHTPLMDLVILLKGFGHSDYCCSHSGYSRRWVDIFEKLGHLSTLSTSWHCAAPCIYLLQDWRTYPNFWEGSCLLSILFRNCQNWRLLFLQTCLLPKQSVFIDL